jgi:hypothetical protein
VAGPGAASRGGTLHVEDVKDATEAIEQRGYAPEDSFGICPDFNQNRVQIGWRG